MAQSWLTHLPAAVPDALPPSPLLWAVGSPLQVCVRVCLLLQWYARHALGVRFSVLCRWRAAAILSKLLALKLLAMPGMIR
jgi:hypothetical protein